MTERQRRIYQLFNAARDGDLATVRAVRESGVDVIGSRQEDGMSSILPAAKTGTLIFWTISSLKERIQTMKSIMVAHA